VIDEFAVRNPRRMMLKLFPNDKWHDDSTFFLIFFTHACYCFKMVTVNILII
jgi:hypothetical protein